MSTPLTLMKHKDFVKTSLFLLPSCRKLEIVFAKSAAFSSINSLGFIFRPQFYENLLYLLPLLCIFSLPLENTAICYQSPLNSDKTNQKTS